jgi:hypothetical protein
VSDQISRWLLWLAGFRWVDGRGLTALGGLCLFRNRLAVVTSHIPTHDKSITEWVVPKSGYGPTALGVRGYMTGRWRVTIEYLGAAE